jgi:hypothetical protein
MNKVLRWSLYILLGLVALAVVGGVLSMIFGGYGYGMMRPGFRMMEPIRGYYHPERSIFGGLLCLGVIGLVIVGVVALVYALTHRNRPSQITTPAQMTAAPAEVTAPPAEAAVPAAEMAPPAHTCPNCGKPAQEDWKTCPYCGNPLT